MKKLSILLLSVLLISLLAFNTGCKKKFDITGVWSVNINWSNFAQKNTQSISGQMSSIQSSAAVLGIYTFSGDKTSGTFVDSWGDSGTYTVSDKNVVWVYNTVPYSRYTGISADDNTMTGTMSNDWGSSGNWTATRNQ